MSILVGDMLPHGTFQVMGEEGPETLDVIEFFAGKTVLMFAVPGAFTPTCSASHLLTKFSANLNSIPAPQPLLPHSNRYLNNAVVCAKTLPIWPSVACVRLVSLHGT